MIPVGVCCSVKIRCLLGLHLTGPPASHPTPLPAIRVRSPCMLLTGQLLSSTAWNLPENRVICFPAGTTPSSAIVTMNFPPTQMDCMTSAP